MKTWRELESEGVRRCCAMFISGGRCRRRAVDGAWCKKHGSIMQREIDKSMKAVYAQLRCDSGDDEDSV
jgi:hypothetical protein